MKNEEEVKLPAQWSVNLSARNIDMRKEYKYCIEKGHGALLQRKARALIEKYADNLGYKDVD